MFFRESLFIVIFMVSFTLLSLQAHSNSCGALFESRYTLEDVQRSRWPKRIDPALSGQREGPFVWSGLYINEGPHLFRTRLEENQLPSRAVPQLVSKLIYGAEILYGYLLLQRQGPEGEFASAVVRNIDLFRESGEQRSSGLQNINSESTTAFAWWTYAPYIYTRLLENGFAERDAIRRLVKWAEESPDGRGNKQNGKIVLRGFESELTPSGFHFLTEDYTHVSHRLAEQEASRLVRELRVFSLSPEQGE